MDNEQPILGIVATINGNDITKGANDLVNNVKRIESAADGAAKSITNAFSTLQLQLAKVNEQIALSQSNLDSLRTKLSQSSQGSGNSDVKVVEMEKKLNSLVQERINLTQKIQQQSKNDPIYSGKKVNSSYKEELKELTRQQKEYTKQLEQSLNERARIENELVKLSQQQAGESDNLQKVEQWKSVIQQQKEYIRNLGEIKTYTDETGKSIEVYPNGWESATAQLKVFEAHLEKLQQTDPATKQMAALEKQLQGAENAVEANARKVQETKDAISAVNTAIAESAQNSETLTKRLRAIREEMQRMRMSGNSNTQEYSDLAEEAKKIQAAMKQTRADADAQTPIFSKLTGGVTMYKNMLDQLPPAISGGIRQMEQLIRVSLRFIATPLGAMIAGLVLAFKALSSWFTNTAEGQQAWAKISGYCEGVVDRLTNKVYKLINGLREMIGLEDKKTEKSDEEKQRGWYFRKGNDTTKTQQDFETEYKELAEKISRYRGKIYGNAALSEGETVEDVKKALKAAEQRQNYIRYLLYDLEKIGADGFWEKTKVWFKGFGIEIQEFADGLKDSIQELHESGEAMKTFESTMLSIQGDIESQKLLDAATDAKISQLQSLQGSPIATISQKMGIASQIGFLSKSKIQANKNHVDDQIKAFAALYNLNESQLNTIRSGAKWSSISDFGISDKEKYKELQSLLREQISLEAELTTTSTNTANTIKQQQMELIEARQQYVERILSLDKQLSRQQADAVYEQKRIEIDAMLDSAQKRKQLRELEHQQVLLNIEREKEDARKAAEEQAKEDYNSNPNLGKRVWDGSLLNIAYGSEEYGKLNQHDQDIVRRYREALGIASMNAENKTNQENADYTGINDILEKYQNFTMQRIALDVEYQTEHDRIMQAIEKTDDETTKARLRGALEALDKENKQRRESLAGNVFQDKTKNDRLYQMATGDLNGLSFDTLRILTSRLKELEEIPDLDQSQVDSLRNLNEEIQRMIDKKSPLQELIDAENKLSELRATELSLARGITTAKKSGSKSVTYTDSKGEKQTVSMNEALDLLYNISRGIKTQENTAEDSRDKIVSSLSSIFNSLQNIGSQIGGNAGAIIGAVGSIGNTWASSYMNGKDLEKKIETKEIGKGAGNTMAVLQGIEAGISVGSSLTRLFESTGVSKQARYEKYAASLNDANELTNSLNRYRIALAATAAAEQRWFGNNPLGDLRSKWEESRESMIGYYTKLRESQAIYQNQSKHEGDWLGNVIVGSVAGAITGAVIGNIPGAIIGGIVGGVAGATTSFAEQYFNGLSYKEGQTAAMDNLRIETRAKKSSFLWIGGHDQETADLRTWAKQTYGRDLFDKKGMIDADMAQEIIDTYGDKLQGQTQATLEQLIKLREKYDEYMDQLKEYVNSLYSPLADSMTNAIWKWYDSGIDALTAFRDAAGDTFRKIANDLLQSIVMKKIFGTFEDDILDLYDKMNAGVINEETLFTQVSLKTSEVMDKYEKQIPYLQGVITSMSDVAKDVLGVDLSSNSSDSQSASRFSVSFNQDSIDEANGRMTALQLGQLTLIEGQSSILSQMIEQSITLGAISMGVGMMRGDVSEIKDILYESNGYLYQIMLYTANLKSIEQSMRNVERNTSKL